MKVYLDNKASTPLDLDVIKSMKPYYNKYYGNPSSGHWLGKKGKNALEVSRKQVADLIGAKPSEIIFTSGGSESNNHALKGICLKHKNKGNHIITSIIEHPAIINPCKFLEKQGFKVTYIGVDKNGMVDVDEIKNSITDKTIIISIMHANNETGTIQPIAEIGRIAREKNIYFHTDAAQTVGKIPIDVNKLNVDLLSIAGHKFHAPKGVGALYIKEGVELENLIHGANHEYGKRAGTENVAGIVGLGKACEIACENMEKNNNEIQKLRDLLYEKLKSITDIKLNSHFTERLPNTLNVSFVGIDSSELLSKLKNIALSTGSACHDNIKEPSAILTAMNVPKEIALGSVRFSLGKYNTEEEIDFTIKEIEKVIGRRK